MNIFGIVFVLTFIDIFSVILSLFKLKNIVWIVSFFFVLAIDFIYYYYYFLFCFKKVTKAFRSIFCVKIHILSALVWKTFTDDASDAIET